MDLVNSVTQNSNNRNVTMENQGDDDDGGKKNSNNNNKSKQPQQQHQHQQQSQDGAENQFIVATSDQPQAQAKTEKGDKSHVPDYLKAIGMDPKKFWPKKYRFTREKSPGQYNPLSIAQRNFYETNGYIVINECVSQKLLDSIKTQYKESALVNDFLLDKLLAKNGKLLQYVKCFCDEKVMLMTYQLVESFQTDDEAKAIMDNQQSQRQQLHRDWIYLPFRPIDKVVCAITAIEPIEHVILVVPGTHRVGQCSISSTLDTISAAYDTSQERAQQLIARELFECAPERLSSLVEKSKKGFKYINLKPGQTLFYHPGLVHGFSDDLVNFKKKQLASIAYYAAADCEYIDLRKTPELMPESRIPISLSQFKDKNPSDYSSWIDKPKLIRDHKASL